MTDKQNDANDALPDGQFQDQQMPTTDGEPADPDPQPEPTGENSAADAGAESQDEGRAAMKAAEEATKNSED
ncbi:hypothetical protein FM104_01060 [Microbacterium esteraromaticum]|uniref:Uncharacterized protein n=1 Tax=Microbacterium esteraromaticum TaxID=57043 RepID=A0A1R4IAT9_9MICO|nr:hypothetical protein [Microbacterium esteraromaticum]SJN16724.1 hypothetical protein FM104_01060 [Microbacterium esteraromaticum]